MTKKLPLDPAHVRVLAIHAHPDDVEFQCAGPLALLGELGCHLTIATMTAGDCGSAELDSLQIAAIRRGEAAQAAACLNADYLCLEFQDLQIDHDSASRRRVTEILRRTRPDLIFTAPPVDYMCDHEATSQLVRDISSASREQAADIQELDGAMSRLNQVTQHNASASEQLAATAEELSAQAATVQERLSAFRFD